MSHEGQVETQIKKESNDLVVTWARYNSAETEFEQLRKKLIKQIMVMEIKKGADFFTDLQQKIDEFKKEPVLDRIVKSVRTGQALNEISEKCIDQNVHLADTPVEKPEDSLKEAETHQSTIEESIQKFDESHSSARPTQQVNQGDNEQTGIVEVVPQNQDHITSSEVSNQVEQPKEDLQLNSEVTPTQEVQVETEKPSEEKIEVSQTKPATDDVQPTVSETKPLEEEKNIQISVVQQNKQEPKSEIIESKQEEKKEKKEETITEKIEATKDEAKEEKKEEANKKNESKGQTNQTNNANIPKQKKKKR